MHIYHICTTIIFVLEQSKVWLGPNYNININNVFFSYCTTRRDYNPTICIPDYQCIQDEYYQPKCQKKIKHSRWMMHKVTQTGARV